MKKNLLTIIVITIVFIFSFLVYLFFYGFFDKGDVRYPKDANYSGMAFPSFYKAYHGNQLQYITYQQKLQTGTISKENDKYLHDFLYYLERHQKRYSTKDIETIEKFLKDGVKLHNPLLHTSNIEAMKLFIQYYGKEIVNDKKPKRPIIKHYDKPLILNLLLKNGAKPHSSTQVYTRELLSLLKAYINVKIGRLTSSNIYLRSDQNFITKQAYATLIRSKLTTQSSFSPKEIEYLKKFIRNRNYRYYDTFSISKDIRRILKQRGEI